MKNILFIIPTLCGGGAEKTVANLSIMLADEYNVNIAVFKNTKMKYSYRGNLIVLNATPNNTLVRKGLFVLKAIRKIRTIKKEMRIDYSVSFLTPADIFNVLTKTKGSKTIISIRNTDSVLLNRPMRLLTRISCKKCDHIVAISNQVKDDIVGFFKINKDKITTIYNPASLVDFSKGRSKIQKQLFGPFTAISVGRLTEQKGQWHLIRAFSAVVRKYPDAKLIILGQGPLKGYLQKLICGYGLESNVSLLGFVDNPYDYMRAASCFVFSSLYEGLGNVLLEALSCGLPIISSDYVSGAREILAPNTNYKEKVIDSIDYAEYGILVPVCDGVKRNNNEKMSKEEIILSDAICELIVRRDLLNKYKKKASVRCKDFGSRKIADEWKRLLK